MTKQEQFFNLNDRVLVSFHYLKTAGLTSFRNGLACRSIVDIFPYKVSIVEVS